MHEACNNSVEYLTNLNNIDVYQRPSGMLQRHLLFTNLPVPLRLQNNKPMKKG